MFNLIPKEVRFFDYFEQQSQHIIRAAALLHEMVHNFGDARAKAHAIKEVEHAGRPDHARDHQELNKTFITPLDREDIHGLTTRLDDVLDYIEAAAERLVVYRIKERDLGVPGDGRGDRADRAGDWTAPSSACATHGPRLPRHAVEINRLENNADRSAARRAGALFNEKNDPLEVMKWRDIHEALETATDRARGRRQHHRRNRAGARLIAIDALARRRHRPGRRWSSTSSTASTTPPTRSPPSSRPACCRRRRPWSWAAFFNFVAFLVFPCTSRPRSPRASSPEAVDPERDPGGADRRDRRGT